MTGVVGDFRVNSWWDHWFRSTARSFRGPDRQSVAHVLSYRLDDRLSLILAQFLGEPLRIRRLLTKLLRRIDPGVWIERYRVHHRLRVLAVGILRLRAELSVTRWLRHHNPGEIWWLRTSGLRRNLRAVLNRHVLTLPGKHRIGGATLVQRGISVGDVPGNVAGSLSVLSLLRIHLRSHLELTSYLRVLGLIVIGHELRLSLHRQSLSAGLRDVLRSLDGGLFLRVLLRRKLPGRWMPILWNTDHSLLPSSWILTRLLSLLLLLLLALASRLILLSPILGESVIFYGSIFKAVGQILFGVIGRRLGSAVLTRCLLILHRLPDLVLLLAIVHPPRTGLRHAGGPHRRSSADVAENSPQSAHRDDLPCNSLLEI